MQQQLTATEFAELYADWRLSPWGDDWFPHAARFASKMDKTTADQVLQAWAYEAEHGDVEDQTEEDHLAWLDAAVPALGAKRDDSIVPLPLPEGFLE